ncbi:TPA: response regulator [Burkholderia cenocepacia]
MIRTILAIDDSATMRALLQATLAQAGYDVTVAPDGEAGFDMAATAPYDLVLTDQNMPRKNGLEVIAALRITTTSARARPPRPRRAPKAARSASASRRSTS